MSIALKNVGMSNKEFDIELVVERFTSICGCKEEESKHSAVGAIGELTETILCKNLTIVKSPVALVVYTVRSV